MASENACTPDEAANESSTALYSHQAKSVPFRMQQVAVSWLFLIASTTLILDFAALQTTLRHVSRAGNLGLFDELCNWFGVVSCVCWLFGFIVLAHWLHSVGATRMGLAGCCLKIIASVFFNLQPMTGTMNDPLLGGSAGLWWSNLTGILFFHSGNLVSCLDFFLHAPPGSSKTKGWAYHGNLPITGMWVYQLATWFLVVANFLACSFNGAAWAPLVPTTGALVAICQFAGSGLLLAGTIVYTVWCDGFRNFSHAPRA